MRPGYVSLSSLALLAISAGCNHTVNSKPAPVIEQYIVVPNAVPLDIESVKGTAGTSTWLCTYTAQGKTARFRLEFAAANPFGDNEAQRLNRTGGKGRFLAEPGSDATVLLSDLGKALEANSHT